MNKLRYTRLWIVLCLGALFVLALPLGTGSAPAQPALAQGFPTDFSAPQVWSDYFCLDGMTCMTGDVNGDGMDDLIAFGRSTDPNGIWVALSQGSQFAPYQQWYAQYCAAAAQCLVGDVDGDGRDDLIIFQRSNDGRVSVGLSTGSSFASVTTWHDTFCYGEEECRVGDLNGDGLDDIWAFVRSTKTDDGAGDVWIATSNGSAFNPAEFWHDSFCYGTEVCAVDDVDGDGRDDMLAFIQSDGGQNPLWVSLSTDQGAGEQMVWYDNFCAYNASICTTGDFDGDSRADAIIFLRDAAPGIMGYSQRQGRVDVATSNGAAFTSYGSRLIPFCTGQQECDTGDFDGDGRDDIVAFVRGADPVVWVALSAFAGASDDRFNRSVRIGDLAEVTEAGNSLWLRPAPSSDLEGIMQLGTGTLVDVLEGPVISEDMLWFEVQLHNNASVRGWFPGESATARYLRPAAWRP
ncbi:MAG: hypothetical protein GYB65_09175 [Chloroflexi bacterium]|nr:hypothetical protein [Chloroflexota bacterium]